MDTNEKITQKVAENFIADLIAREIINLDGQESTIANIKLSADILGLRAKVEECIVARRVFCNDEIDGRDQYIDQLERELDETRKERDAYKELYMVKNNALWSLRDEISGMIDIRGE